jgi:hypothetical protein
LRQEIEARALPFADEFEVLLRVPGHDWSIKRRVLRRSGDFCMARLAVRRQFAQGNRLI